MECVLVYEKTKRFKKDSNSIRKLNISQKKLAKLLIIYLNICLKKYKSKTTNKNFYNIGIQAL